ncbi:MAG: AAA family ATPase [Nitrospirae bacterium]|nr:AAA family ATPase [Nitrospirota bacterium]
MNNQAPAYFYPSSTHNEGLLLLDYSIEQKEGFTTIIGDPGSGKTTLLNVFLEKWKPKAEIAMILTPRLLPEEFLVSVLEDLNIQPAQKNKNEIIKAFRDFMIAKSSEDKRVIIIIDEAQNLPADTLEELRLLSNLETDKDKLLQIVLLGQPELESKLTAAKLRQLNQRILTRIHLRPLSDEETSDYINHRLIKAGKRNLKINKKAGKLIPKYSKGIPRLINMLMSRTLMAAFLEESTILHPRHIRHAVKSLQHDDLSIKKDVKLIPALAGLLLVITAGFFSFRYLPDFIAGYPVTITVNNELPPTIVTPQPAVIPQQQGTESNVQDTAVKTDESASANADNAASSEGKEPAGKSKALVGQYVIIRANAANLRDAPSFTSNTVRWALKGEKFEILDKSEDSKWYQILRIGEKLWIARAVVRVE